MFDCICNTQNSLLSNQHNGDDAPQKEKKVTISFCILHYFFTLAFCIGFYIVCPQFIFCITLRFIRSFLILMSWCCRLILLYIISSLTCNHFLLRKTVLPRFFVSLYFRSEWYWFTQFLTKEMVPHHCDGVCWVRLWEICKSKYMNEVYWRGGSELLLLRNDCMRS